MMTEENGAKPAEQEAKPAEQEAKPAEQEAKPAEQEAKPAEQEAKPAEQEAKPAEQEAKPAEQEAKPAEQEAKPAEQEAKPAEFESYTLEAPEGLAVEEASLKAFSDFANSHKIPKEDAVIFSKSFAEAQESARQELVASWKQEAEADKELGGAKFEENLALAKKAVRALGGEEAEKLLDVTGLGSHKSILKAFRNAGKMMADDEVPSGGETAPKEPVTFQSALFAAASKNQ